MIERLTGEGTVARIVCNRAVRSFPLFAFFMTPLNEWGKKGRPVKTAWKI
jgi:hypothetical protein